MSRLSLVVLQTPLVAQDLALTLEELTGGPTRIADSMDAALEALAGLAPGALRYAFVQSDSVSFRAHPLSALVRRLGGLVALMGHAAEVEANRGDAQSDWPVLAQPFGSAQVAEVLERLRPAALPD